MGNVRCTLQNDTDYQVVIVDYDGTRDLNPGTSQGNYLVKGMGFGIDLVMKFPGSKEEKINFPSSKFENRPHRISVIFSDKIRAFESEHQKYSLAVVGGVSRWHLAYNHPGHYEETVTIETVTKNSWKDMQEKGFETELKVGAMIKAVELSASFKAYTKLTRVDEYESTIKKSQTRKFTEICYVWQEIVAVKTDHEAPFDTLDIPTAHTEVTTTPHEPNKEVFLFAKK